MIGKLNYDPLRDLPAFEHKVLYDKINEIIDVINKLEGEKMSREEFSREPVDIVYKNAKLASYNQGFLDGYKRGVEDAKEMVEKNSPNSIDLGDRDIIKLKILPLELAGHDLKIGDKTEFTWDEAVEEVKEMESSGWRLPTAHEWVLIAEELALAEDGNLGGEKLLKTMHCDSYYGHWWSSTSNGSSNASYLYAGTNGNVYPRDCDGRGSVFSVRLVREVKEKSDG